jgi:hypothetical protein
VAQSMQSRLQKAKVSDFTHVQRTLMKGVVLIMQIILRRLGIKPKVTYVVHLAVARLL